MCCVCVFGVVTLVASRASEREQDIEPVVIDYFYEKGCPQCSKVNEVIRPELELRFEGFYCIREYDVGVRSNVVILASYQKQLAISNNAPVCMVVDFQHVFSGFDQIKTGLLRCVERSIEDRLRPGWQAPQPIVSEGAVSTSVLRERVQGFTLAMVVVAGLIDGINPCAIASLVFFMSFLAISNVRGRGILLMGVSFCLASFVTYTALGFGLLRALHLLEGFDVLRTILEISMMMVLGVLAFLSFRDAYRYRASGDSRRVSVQLPDALKRRIRSVIRSGVNRRSLVLGGLMTGFLVTALESVCTGQVYVPTLAAVIKSGELLSDAWKYLLVYNAMFITPVVVVFVMTYYGLRTKTLMKWSKANVVMSKVLLGLFFLAMAVMIGCM